jgi:hypothetical protein
MYAYVVKDADGNECVPASKDTRTGMWLPLMGADLDRMRSFRPLVEEMAQQEGRPFHLVHFTTRTEVDVIEAPEAPQRPQEAREFEPAPPEADAAYQSFDEPLAMANIIHADGVLVAGSACENGEFGLTIAFVIDGDWSPPVMVKGKVADDLMSLAKQAKEAYLFREN